jgi:ribonucleoside-diphosphate reductase beta chain
MVENKIYIGNGNIISLILQDELLHTEWTAWLINNVTKDDPFFLELEKECAEEVYQMYIDVIREEKEWADYLFSKGPVIGLNATILKDFVDHTAFSRLKDIGIKYLEDHPRSSPIPWFNKHVNINKKQTALQENESTNYVIGVMSDRRKVGELGTDGVFSLTDEGKTMAEEIQNNPVKKTRKKTDSSVDVTDTVAVTAAE